MLTAFLNLEVLVTCGVFFLFFLWLYFFFPFPCFFPLCTDLPANSLVWSVGNVQSLNTSINTLTSRSFLLFIHGLALIPSPPTMSCQTHKTFPWQREELYRYWCITMPGVFCAIFRSWWPLWRGGGRMLNQGPGSWVALKQLLERRSGRAGGCSLSGCLWKILRMVLPLPRMQMAAGTACGSEQSQGSLWWQAVPVPGHPPALPWEPQGRAWSAACAGCVLRACDTHRPQDWGCAEGQQEILKFLDMRVWKKTSQWRSFHGCLLWMARSEIIKVIEPS